MQKFVTALTDMSFKKFVTPQLATYIYIIGIIFSGVYSLLLLKLPFGFLLAPVNFVAGVIFIRCLLELTLAVFQIARYSAEIARRGRPPHDETDDQGISDSGV
jgi:hypothetical protein